MKVNDILSEMDDEDIIGDTGEKPVLSDQMKKRKAAGLEAARVRRDMSTRSKGRRSGRRGTAQADQSMVQK